MNLTALVWLFVAASIIGWVIDTLTRSIEDRRYSPGGFSILPVCPIYGWGALLLVVAAPLLLPLPIVVQFAAVVLILTVLEYTSSIISEAVLCRRLWDYSKNPFNLHGRIDAIHSLGWGALGLAFLHVIYPMIEPLMVS